MELRAIIILRIGLALLVGRVVWMSSKLGDSCTSAFTGACEYDPYFDSDCLTAPTAHAHAYCHTNFAYVYFFLACLDVLRTLLGRSCPSATVS